MERQRLTRSRAVTVLGLLVGALGIAILWASGVEFPIYPPPGLVILLAGAAFVGLAPWRWAPDAHRPGRGRDRHARQLPQAGSGRP
jgi:hypothetical protein